MSASLPHWDLTNIYPSLASPEFQAAFADYRRQIHELAARFDQRPFDGGPPLLAEMLERFNRVYALESTLRSYIHSFVSTDSRDTLAAKAQSEFEQARLPLLQTGVRFKAWIGGLGAALEDWIAAEPSAQAHAFALRETAQQARYLMSEAEENLAAELNLSGGNAWSKLQGVVTSQIVVDFELDGAVQKLPLPALINLHAHPDESVRQRAYKAELAALEAAREPLAACLNGVKGAVHTLDRRRGRAESLDTALDDARIDRATLEAMLSAMQAAFPVFRRYFQAKAARLGKERLPWWDLFAPTSAGRMSFTYPEARAFILDNFAAFSPDLAAFAQQAFEQNWLDVEQRPGKRGGAFCMALASVRQSRILSNFDGSLDQVSTIAHELGHAFHNHCAFQAGKTELQRRTPMTLAETASTMCETIVMQAALGRAADPQQALAILETMLIGDSQVIVDIASRFIFEQQVFERRQKAELSADDFCQIMLDAQRQTYGDGLDERYLHPYMWTWKPHYYMLGLSYYNFPYAFGLLFSMGLYALYQQRGAAFIPAYVDLLASTGEANAADLAARFGIDIRSSAFWEHGLAVMAQRIERYIEIPA